MVLKKILEALSATGLRSVRYWKEIPNLHSIVANDLSEDAVKEIKRNLEYNEISEKQIIPNHGDANDVMFKHKNHFDVIDLDPYGSVAPFLDAAIQSIKDGGLLLITCTDMQALAGSQIGTCYTKYGSVPLKSKACHEMALRIVLASAHQIASKHGKYITPLLSCSIDFYVRLFIQVKNSPNETKIALTKVSNMFKCINCEAFHLVPLGVDKGNKSGQSDIKFGKECEICGNHFKMGGPYWNQAIQNTDFASVALDHAQKNSKLYATSKRMIGVLSLLSNEISDPLFYDFPSICSQLKINSPPLHLVRSAIMNAGYKVSQTHCDPSGIKTNAPIQYLFEAVVEWMKKEKKEIKYEKGSLYEKFLNIKSNFKFDFTFNEKSKIKEKGLFLPNPEPNWGPKPRAKKRKFEEEVIVEKKN